MIQKFPNYERRQDMLSRDSFCLLFFVFFSCGSLYAQGLPRIEVYTPEDYGDFRQNWDITQHEKGYLFFGNGNGLIRFDGAEWQSERVLAGRIVRTFATADGIIHWGGDGNFGIIGSDSLGALKPLSFREKIDSENRTIGRIWSTFEYNGNVYHRTSDAIYKVRSDSVSVISGDTYTNVLSLYNQLVINRRDHPLSSYKDGQFRDIPGSEIYDRETIVVSLPFRNGYLLGSRSIGLIYFDGTEFTPFQTAIDDYLDENLIYKAIRLNEKQLAFATLRGGIVVIDENGEHLYTLTEDEGLSTNIVYDLFVDAEQTLWASTDNGIIKILANHPVTVLNEFSGLSGSPTFVEHYHGRIYIGTTDGLFATEGNGKVRRVGDRPAYFFDRAVIGDHFYAATNDGLFLVSGFEMEKLHSIRTEKLVAHPGQHNTAFAGSQNNVYRYRPGNGSAQVDTLLSMASNITSIYADDRFLWLALENRTVRRVDLSDFSTTETFDIAISEDSRLHDLQLIDGKVMLSTNHGIYYFNNSSHSFEPDSTYGDPELNRYQVTRIRQCPNGDIWFRNRAKIKRAVRKSDGWQVFENSFRSIGKGQAITSIQCAEDGPVWISSSTDVYHIQDPEWQFDHQFQTNITFAATETDTLYLGGGAHMPAPELSYDNNNLRFRYAAASFVAPEETEYRFRLSGYEEDWSDWSSETQKDYTFIREGTYTFEVESRNIFQVTGSRSSYTFTILPPWYRTMWAYAGYFLLAMGLIYGGHRVRVNTILREQRIRDGIARDLHDELSSTLSSIHFFADAIDSKRLDVKESDRFLSLIQKSSQEAKEKISDIVWVVHSENDDWENLLLRCKRLGADMLDARGVQHRFIVEGAFAGKPAITDRKNIWLIFREILTNIARHAEPTQVEIRFSRKSGRLYLHIEDNGKGFETDSIKRDGYGVQNIKERVNLLKGRCTLQSKPGKGTRWEIELPAG